MFAKLFALIAKQKFIRELENNIPETGNFKTIKCRAAISVKCEIGFELLSTCSGEKRAIIVTAEKNGCRHTENLLTGTNSEVLEWLKNTGKKELAEKADEALYKCSHFYYP